jgi:UDP-N-acetylmuramoyl-L-alanyl-D-glutamate--2,6-diaminopimelate ligase
VSTATVSATGPAGLTLARLVDEAGLPADAVEGDGAVVVGSVEHDSRLARPGTLYCCLRGATVDGHVFAPVAVAGGATALLVDHHLTAPDLAEPVPQVLVPDTRPAMGRLAAAFHGHPSRAMTMVGVTGTNGKTTVTTLLAAVLDHAGIAAGTIGTLTGAHTTPESPELQARLAGFVHDGKGAVVMEVSSHALTFQRVAGCHFDVAVFTNLGHDHLDLHGTVEAYYAAKSALFDPTLSARAVINADDEHGRRLLATVAIPAVSFSLDDVDDLRVGPTSHSYRWRGQHVEVGIGGRFNASNSLAAATVCAELGIAEDVIAAGLRAAPVVPGRFEPVRAGQPFDVIVDFAHTPDGLREALTAARPEGFTGAVIVVFGAGGDRDRAKRPEMGAVAAELADRVVITSDNPRSEDPLAIIGAITAGVDPSYRHRLVTEPDRRRAIAAALAEARPGDVVVIAGKGHESTQTIGDRQVPFDDRRVARELLEAAP